MFDLTLECYTTKYKVLFSNGRFLLIVAVHMSSGGRKENFGFLRYAPAMEYVHMPFCFHNFAVAFTGTFSLRKMSGYKFFLLNHLCQPTSIFTILG